MSAVTFGTLTRFVGTGASTYSQSFTVTDANAVLIVDVFHEGSVTSTTSCKFNSVSMTPQGVSSSGRLQRWAIIPGATGTHNVDLVLAGTTNCVMEIYEVYNCDITAGLSSAIKGTAVWNSDATAGTDVNVTVTSTVDDAMMTVACYFNDDTKTLSFGHGETTLVNRQERANTNKWTYAIGYLDVGAAGAYALGCTASGANSSPAAGNRSAIGIAFKDNTSFTLADLTLTQTTIAPGINEDVSFTIAGKTSGSTVKLYNGVTEVASTIGTTITITGGFATAGLKTLTVVETLAGATNTPHTSAASVSLRIYITLKIGTVGSSSLDHWTLPNSWATTETPDARIKVWNVSSVDGSGPGGYVGIASYAGTNFGCGAVAFGNRILHLLDVDYPDTYRIGFAPTAKGGSTLAGWIAPQPYYTNLVSVFAAMGGVDCLLSVVGSNDARTGNISSKAQFIADLRTLFSNVRTDTGLSTLQIFMMGAQRSTANQSFTGTATTTSGSNQITVTALTSGSCISVGQVINCANFTGGTVTISSGPADGRLGVYTVSANAASSGSVAISNNNVGDEDGRDYHWARCRGGELTVGEDANNHIADTVVDLPLQDKVHLTIGVSGGEAARARRVAESVFKVLFNGTGAHQYAGPKMGTPTYYSANGLVIMPFTCRTGAELVGQTGQPSLDGFEFFSSADTGFASPLTPSTAPYVSGPTQVAAVVSTGLAGIVVRYQEKRNPAFTNCLMDNGFHPDAVS